MDVQMPDGTIVTGVPDNITQSELLSRYKNFQPPEGGLPTLTSTLEPTSNPLYGLVSRGAGLIGSGLEAIQRVGDYATLKAVNAVPFTNFTPEQAAEVSRPDFVGRAANKAKAYSEGINYTPSTTLGDLGDNPIKVLPFIAERIITSTPDMAAAVFAAPAYVTARTNEILNERLKNDEKELKDATVSDVASSLVGAVIEQKLESFATKGLFKGRKLTGKNAGTRILKEMGVQSTTEGLEEAASNIAGSLGTKRGVDPRELGENVLEGIIVGAGLGGGVRSTQEYLQSRKKPDADFTEPKTFTDPDTGVKRVYSYTPIDDPTLELGGTPEINGRKTYIYTEKPLDTKAPLKDTSSAASESQEQGAPASESLNTDEMIAEFGGQQLPLTPPVSSQEISAQDDSPASSVSAPVEQPSAEDIVPLDDNGDPVAEPKEVAAPADEAALAAPIDPPKADEPAVDPNTEARLAAEPFDPDSIILPPIEEPPARIPKPAKVKASDRILSAHEFIASLGGLDKKEASEINKDAAKSNVRIGNKWLYASKGGLSAAQAAEKLREANYIADEDNNSVYQVIADSLVNPVYSLNDADAIAERQFNERELDEADRLNRRQANAAVEAQDISAESAAEQAIAAADLGNFRQQMLDAGYTEQDLNVIGFTKASPELQAEVAALQKQVTDAGLDPYGVLEGLKGEFVEGNITRQEYYAKAKTRLEEAIREKAVQGGGRNVSQANVPESAAREEGLTSPSEQELRDQQEAADKADAAKAKADRDAAAKEKAEAERKEIAARSEKAADEFVLGQDAQQNLSGQKDIDSLPEQISPEQQKLNALNTFEEVLSNTVPTFRGRSTSTVSVIRPKALSTRQIALLKDLASEAIDLGMPPSLLANISAAGSTGMNSIAAISASRGWLLLGRYWPSRSRAEKLQSFIHEFGHSVDNTNERVSEKPVFQKAYDELANWFSSSTNKIKHPLAYPFDRQFAGKLNLKTEAFAQAFSYYFTSPVDLQTNAPEAYSQIRQIIEGIKNESQRASAGSASTTSNTGVKVQPPKPTKDSKLQSDASEVGSGVSQSELGEDRNNKSIEGEAGNAPPSPIGQKDISKIAEKAEIPPLLQAPADFVLKKGRIEQVVLAARALEDGKITKAEYDKYVDYYAPIATVGAPESPLGEEGMKRVLKSNQINKINPEIKNGTRVGLRMDINALKRAQQLSAQTGSKINGSVVSIHEGSGKAKTGKVIGYSGAALIKNARFEIRSEKAAFDIGQGLEDKAPQQTIEGEWVNTTPEDVYSRISSLLKDPSWSQISLDPLRHSFFYDRSNKQPVVSADEILQVGRFVLAKNVKYAEREQFLYSQAPNVIADKTKADEVVSEIKQSERGEDRDIEDIEVAMPVASWVDPGITFKDTFIRKVADRHNDLKTVQKAITEQVGNLRSNVNAYQIQDLAHGRIQTQTADFLDFEFVPILKEMQEKGITDPELTKYLQARHAEEANKLIAERNKNDPMMQDGGSGMDTDVAKRYLASINPSKKQALESVAKKVDNILALTREMLEANGIISKEERDGWEKMFKYYVPLQREQSDYALPTNSYKTIGKFSKSRTGSTGKSVIDILANVGINREVAIVRIEKERVKRAVYGLAVTSPNPEVWKAVSPDAIKNQTVLAQELREMGINPNDVANILSEPSTRYFNKETGQVEARVDQMKRYADFVLPVKINGKDRFIFFNPKNPRAMAMVTALKDMDVQALEGAVASIASVTRFFAAVNTQYNLVFGLFNFARDLQGAMFNLTTTPIADKKTDVAKGAMKALPEIYSALRERNKGKTPSSTADGSYYDFISNGGKVGYRDQFAKIKESTTLVEREFEKLNRGNAKKATYALLNWVSNVNDVLENAVRLSSYRVALDKFKSEAKGNISSAQLSAMKADAAEIAKNITVNFNTKGNATGMVGALYAFTNASIRGTARLIETVDPRTSRGRKIMASLVTLGAVQAIALAMAGFDEDEPSEFIKQKSLVIPLSFLGLEGKKYFMIPMPYGLNIFPNLGRLMVEGSINIAKGRGVKDQVANTFGMLFTAFNPIGGGAGLLPLAPTAADPIVAIVQNRDAFDRPIYREDRSTKPTPGYLRSRDPSSVANIFAEMINTMTGGTEYTKGLVSPTADHINYLAEQVGGGVYREGSRVVKYATDKVTGEETPDYRVPLAGKIVGNLESPAAVSQKFYKNVIRMSEHEDEIKGRISSRQSTSQYIKENPEANLWRRVNTLENELSKINRQRRELIAKDAPREKIKRVEDQRNRMMKQFNDEVKKREAK